MAVAPYEGWTQLIKYFNVNPDARQHGRISAEYIALSASWRDKKLCTINGWTDGRTHDKVSAISPFPQAGATNK
jgi:hypothetical protein